MSQHSSSYSYDSLNDVFNIANRKGKMQKNYLFKEYLDAAQEYREMRKELNDILRKKKELRTESELTRIDELKVKMSENAAGRSTTFRLGEDAPEEYNRILPDTQGLNAPLQDDEPQDQ